MQTETPSSTDLDILPRIPYRDCPLHLAMEAIARVAVKQHVLYLEGECQPRPELLEQLEWWSSLHTLIRSRVCAASRTLAVSPDELERVLDALLPNKTDAAIPSGRQHLRAALSACAWATSCPLGTTPGE